MKGTIRRIPGVGWAVRWLYSRLKQLFRTRAVFPGSAAYWENRYATGGSSGPGSFGDLANFKAEVLNGFVAHHSIQSVIEFGCGDGNQLLLAQYPEYVGFDVSSHAIAQCRQRFRDDPSKTFRAMDRYVGETADLVLSLDVIYHLVEDDVFDGYMRTLFGAAERFVVIYSSNREPHEVPDFESHVRHRRFSHWVDKHAVGWRLAEHLPNHFPYRGDARTGSFADFFVYSRR